MVEPLVSQPYLLRWGTEDAPHGHKLCGRPESEAAICPNCGQPLQRMLSLDLTDDRLGLKESGLDRLELLFCWQCPLAQDAFFYKALTDGSIRILQAGKGDPEQDFPYEDYPRHFPTASLRLEPMDPDLADLLTRHASSTSDELDEWDLETKLKAATPRHQLGGIPFLFDDTPLECPECSQPMPFLATVADENTDPRGFTGNEYVQTVFAYCPLCRIVGARQEVD